MTTYSCDHCGSILNVAPRSGAGNGQWLWISREPFGSSAYNVVCSLECIYKWAQEELEARGKKLMVVVA